jgi:hypothetical protein
MRFGAGMAGQVAAAALCAVLMRSAVAQTGVAANAAAAAAGDVSPPPRSCVVNPDQPGTTVRGCFASDAWVEKSSEPWSQEMARRQRDLEGYLRDTDPARARRYGFRDGHHPALAWNWFSGHPIGYGGVPHVLLQTLLSLDPATEKDGDLQKLAGIWRKKSTVAAEAAQNRYTLDHLGFGPHPEDYDAEGIAKDARERRHALPNGFVYDPEVKAEEVSGVVTRLKILRSVPTLGLLAGALRSKIHDLVYGEYPIYDRDHATFQKPPAVDAVFFACSACHQGRVIVGGRMDAAGNIVERGRMRFMPGMPNTEVEAQYFSQLLMETGLELLESGFALDSTGLPGRKSDLHAKRAVVGALYRRMLDRALDAETVKTVYGAQPEQVRRARLQTYSVAMNFPTHVGELIGTAIKTQYVYLQIAAKHAYHPNNPRRTRPDQRVPDTIGNRIGQMDAFGIASGLVAIHSGRKDNSYLQFICADNWRNPLFGLLGVNPGPACDPAQLRAAGQAIRDTLGKWAPPVPAPVDIPSLSWTGQRELANWDGNQGAAARTLASGTSATGDPSKVNVRMHEPLNPLINNLPPPPYPFAIDRERARRGMAIFNGEHLERKTEVCAECHRPYSGEVVPVAHLGVDGNRAAVNTDISRYGLASLVMEACRIFIRNNQGKNDWCLPRDRQGKVVADWATRNDDYFKDTPGRVRKGEAGYKVDMQHGIWARAPYLHNGSVPTLGQLLCPQARPKKFLRGVLFYDEALVGFEWAVRPRERYSPHETLLIKEYDTTVFGFGNGGHHFGSSLCPDLGGLDPVADRREITRRILDSKVGDLIEYLKTL